MKTAVINFQTQPIIKQKAQKVADELGFGLSTLLNGFLHHLIKTKTIEFSAYEQEQPSEYLIQVLKETERQHQKGEFIFF